MHRLRHSGIDRARRHGIDPDAERREFDRLLLGQMRKASFAGAVGHAQRRGAQPRDRGDVDDCAAALSRMSGAAACPHRNGPVRLTASTRDHSS